MSEVPKPAEPDFIRLFDHVHPPRSRIGRAFGFCMVALLFAVAIGAICVAGLDVVERLASAWKML